MAEKPENTSRNEGEGSRSAARAYNKDTREFVESGKVEKAAGDARKAVDGSEGDELRKAEEQGRSKAKGFDPNVKR